MRKTIKTLLFRCLTVFGMIWRAERRQGERRLYLTFDDGPNPQFTRAVLDVLKDHQALATFFLVGQDCEQYKDLVEQISSAGHTIGNHSYDHADLRQASWDAIKFQIETTDRILGQSSGVSRPLIRPPKGDWGIKYLIYAITRRRKTVFWSLDPKDFACDSASEILERIDCDLLRDGEIVLMHDKSAATVEALRTLIPELKRRGFELQGLQPA